MEAIRETKIFDIQFGCRLAREILRPIPVSLPTPSSINSVDDGNIELPPPTMSSSEKKRPRQQICAAPGPSKSAGGEEDMPLPVLESATKRRKSAVSVLAEIVKRDMNKVLQSEQALLDEDMAELTKVMESIRSRQETIGQTRRLIAAIEAEDR
jgi:hypothetical protein